MGKTCKVVVCGQAATGKTALLEQLIYSNHQVGSPMFSTIEDVYVAHIETARAQKEKVRFYDTAGLDGPNAELPRSYLSYADGFILVYDVTRFESFNLMDKLKKDIEKNKEKKEAVIMALGNKCDLRETREVDFATAHKWAQKEKVRLWEVSVANRASLMEPFFYMASKMTTPQNKSTFSLIPNKKGKSSSES